MSIVTPIRPERSDDRSPPCSPDAEQRVLGALLIDNRQFRKISEFLRAEHFGNALHCRIFTAIGALVERGQTANPVTLKNQFDQDPALLQSGGGQYLGKLAGDGAMVTNAADYARHIVELAGRRALIDAAQETLEQAYRVDMDRNCADIAASLTNRIDEISRGAANRLVGVNPRTLEGLPVPTRRFVVTPWIPMRRATGLYGAGGVGKTTLMQMLCTSTALDPAKFPHVNWLGLPVRPCRSVLLFCEDDLDEMHARQGEINRSYGCTFADLGDMLWMPRLGTDTTLMTFENGRAYRTPAFYELFTVIKKHGAQLAVWDTLTDVFGGSEVDRGQARRFVQEGPAYIAREIDGAVVCCAHPSLTGISSGKGTSGSTGWDGAFRSRLYMSAPKEDDSGPPTGTDERVLTRMKSNWAKIGDTIPMRWRDGVFIADRPPSGIIGSIERRTAERVFLDLLDRSAAEGQFVSHNSRAGNYAPRVFALRPDRERFAKKDFELAMQALFVAKTIIVGSHKDARRRTLDCIVRNDTNGSAHAAHGR